MLISFIDQIKTEYLKKNQIVLDIETTGVDRKLCFIQAVGILTSDKKDNFYQYYAETFEDEKYLLLDLWDLINDKEIISYNGINFDLPFILARMDFHDIRHPQYIKHFDIYRFIIENKYYFDYGEYSLQAIEAYNNIERFEKFEHVEDSLFYEKILDEKARDILVHNKYDVINTEKLLSFVSETIRLKTMTINIENKELSLYLEKVKINNNIMKLSLVTEPINNNYRYENMNYRLQWHDESLEIYMSIKEGYIAKDQLGYVHVQTWDNPLLCISNYKLASGIILIYHNKKLELENIKNLIIRIIDQFIG